SCTRLVLEITETAVISNLIEVKEFLAQVQELGVNIALDDFGSGMASFRYLQSLPLNYLKIDGQFISGLLDDELARATVQSFIDVAGVIDVPTVAEHVENERVASTLVEMGVHFLQGFYLGRPEPTVNG
ncbi:MAG: EAL domain-containing protein, partial [Pseudomonadota bacterium]